MSRTQTFELTCPHCHRDFSAELWTVVNVDTEPHLKTDLLEGRLNVIVCPACHEELGFVPFPFIYHDGASEQVICYAPEEIRSREERRNVVHTLMEALWEELEADEPRFLPPDYFLQRPMLLDDINDLVRIARATLTPRFSEPIERGGHQCFRRLRPPVS